jgi:hypothetical protein
MNLIILIIFIIYIIFSFYFIDYLFKYYKEELKINQIGGDINKDGTFVFDLKDKTKKRYTERKFNKDDYHSKSIKVNKPINNNKFIDSNLQDTYYLSPQFMTYEQQEKFIKHAQLNNMTLKDMHNYINLVQAKYNHKKISPIYKLTDKELNENEILNSLLPKLTNHH